MSKAQPASENWAMAPEQFVNTLYHLLLGREPDEAGFQSHVQTLRESKDPTRIMLDFMGSGECRRRFSLLTGSEAWLSEVQRTDPSRDTQFNDVLHHLRTEELKKSEGTNGTMVSVGCSNDIYFTWIHENLGLPSQHIGLEYYSPKPDNLPDNVRWIANTAGNMADVASGSVDLIFGGQVVEHLWAEELVDFLHEAWRVLKPGGRLIFDTPNERVTRLTGWTHGEHTMEFRPDDARLLLDNLGFSVTKLVGHWLSEGQDGPLRINQIRDDGPYPMARRMAEGRYEADACFNWWVEARRNDGPVPDKAKTRAIVKDMWERYGHHGFNRTTTSDTNFLFRKSLDGNDRYARADKGWSGNLVRSSQNALPPGKMRVGVEIDPYKFSSSPGYLEVRHPQSGEVFGHRALPEQMDGGIFEVEADIPRTTFAGEFVLHVQAEDVMTARMVFFVTASVHAGEMWDLSSKITGKTTD